MNIVAMLQEGAAAGHVAAGEGHAESAYRIVSGVNAVLGPLALAIEKLVMPPVYGLFGAHWEAPPASEAIPSHVVFAVIGVLLCTAGLWLFRGTLSVDRPSKRQQLLEVFVETVRGLLDEVVGPFGRRYLSVIGAFAVFILVGNMMGEIPGLAAPTGNINVTLALGLISFLYFFTRGFKQQGLGYLKHFTGGLSGALLPLGLVIFLFEMLSTVIRPATLGLRLFLNMFADHTIAGVFEQISPWIVPILLPLPLAFFVAFVQTMVFCLLSMAYLAETVPHEEHDEHAAHGQAEAAHAH